MMIIKKIKLWEVRISFLIWKVIINVDCDENWSMSKCKQIYLKHIPLWISAPLTDFLIFTQIKNVSFKKLGHFSCKIQMEVGKYTWLS